jgi:hypothetical protein
MLTEAMAGDATGQAILAQMRRTEAVPQIERHVQYSIRVEIAKFRNDHGVTILSNAVTNCKDSASALAIGKATHPNQRASYLRLPGMWLSAISKDTTDRPLYYVDEAEVEERQAKVAAVQGLAIVLDGEAVQ